MPWPGKLARWGNRLITLAAGLLLGALALYGAWSLWEIAVTRFAALPGETLRFKPLADAADAGPGFAELRALNPDVCGWRSTAPASTTPSCRGRTI